MDQVIDIETDGRHISRNRGFLLVSEEGKEVGRVPLDQIAAVIVHAHGITYSNSILVALAEQGSPVVLCAANHQPRAVLLPLAGHHTQGARMRAQWQAKSPMLKQAWKQVVIRKIEFQAAALAAVGENPEPLKFIARGVRSGDTGNAEAQAARRYWPKMMGSAFRRDTDGAGTNGLLNYGYVVFRAAMSRAIVAAGLNPTIGVHHSNRSNAFALADDLLEPFRPLVDCAVRSLANQGEIEVSSACKRVLARLLAVDLNFGEMQSPVSVAMMRLASSLAMSFESGKLSLALPSPPSPLEFLSLGVFDP